MRNTNYSFLCLLVLFSFFIPNLQSQTCTDPNLYADECDFDGDGFLNIVDLDDDNDGVLDTTEQDCFLSGNLTDGLAIGFHPMDTWLLTHGVRIRHIDPATLTANTTDFRVLGHPSWVAQGDPDAKLIWNGTGISIAFFAADGVTQETSNTFSIWSDPIPIPPPTGLVRVIARDINGVDILDRFDPDGSQHVIDITQTGGVPFHEVVLAFSSSAFDLVNLDGSCLDRDTDNDSFADRFDLDSDADGCSDAFESGATLDLSINFQFADLGGDLDGLSPTVDPAGDGQPDYTSTYALAANDNSINNCPSVLSAQISQFSLEILENEGIGLSWESLTGEEVDHFEIFRLRTGQDWENIGKKAAKEGNLARSVYAFVDSDLQRGRSYYKIGEVYKNGNISFSDTRSILYEALPFEVVVVYPNPFEDELIIRGVSAESYPISLKDMWGRTIEIPEENIENVDGKIRLNMSQLARGLYVLKIGRMLYKVEKQ